jgi:hypothetical protein
MDRESKYFTLSLESLRALGSWAADCAERALSVYENDAHSDSRPRGAIEGIRVFAGGESARLGCVHLPWRHVPLSAGCRHPRSDLAARRLTRASSWRAQRCRC